MMTNTDSSTQLYPSPVPEWIVIPSLQVPLNFPPSTKVFHDVLPTSSCRRWLMSLSHIESISRGWVFSCWPPEILWSPSQFGSDPSPDAQTAHKVNGAYGISCVLIYMEIKNDLWAIHFHLFINRSICLYVHSLRSLNQSEPNLKGWFTNLLFCLPVFYILFL